MSAILIAQNGTLVAISQEAEPDKQALPGLITIQNLKGKDSSAEVLITSFDHSAEVAHQSVPTIGGPEYLYVFGDKLHEIRIGLVMYPGRCGGAGVREDSDGYSSAWKFYKENRITPQKAEPVSITFGSTQITGLVVGFRVTAAASQGFAVIEGILSLKGWVSPENQQSAPGAAAANASGANSGAAPPLSAADAYLKSVASNVADLVGPRR